MAADRLLGLAAQALALAVQVLDHAFVLVHLHGRDRRGERMGLRAVGGREQEHARPVVVIEPAQAHVLAPPGERRHREAVGERLAEGGEVGDDVVQLLRAAVVPAEAGDHLVQDQQRAVGVAQALQRVQVARRRVLGARRLEDQRGDAPGVLLEQRRGAGQIAVAEGRGQLADACGMPAFIAVVPMNQSSVEKNGWSAQHAIMSRPV